ncbi:MAG: haloacid dehalogenase-like hydrolase [Firmicutes bacterium]|nr:haloacid dehalogenase-like hydrolase [Bacillota bacterium]
MITITLPNGQQYSLTNAVFDYNGTLAEDGILAAGVKELLEELVTKINVSVLTADTFGLARAQLESVKGINLKIVEKGNEASQKREFIESCGKESTICFGNGANDIAMFGEATLAVAVIGAEGAYQPTIAQADIVVTNPRNAILLLLKPTRMVATLRV